MSAVPDPAIPREAGPAGDPFVEVEDEAGVGSVFECGLCGTSFTHGGRVCGSCPLNAGCDLVRCPNCGYQFPRSSRIAEWGRRWWRRWVAPGGRRR